MFFLDHDDPEDAARRWDEALSEAATLLATTPAFSIPALPGDPRMIYLAAAIYCAATAEITATANGFVVTFPGAPGVGTRLISWETTLPVDEDDAGLRKTLAARFRGLAKACEG